MNANMVMRWEQWVKDVGLSDSAASVKIGRDRSYLRKLFTRARNCQSVDPAASAVDALGRVLGRSHDEMMGRGVVVEVTPEDETNASAMHEQAAKVVSGLMRAAYTQIASEGQRLSIEDVLSWWRVNNGDLIQAETILDSCDVVMVPQGGEETVQVVSIGKNSLAAQTLGGNKLPMLMRCLRALPDDARVEMMRSYKRADMKREPTLNGPHVMTITPEHAPAFDVYYMRLQLPVQTPDGSRFVLNYSFPV